MNSMKRQKDMTLKGELPCSVGVQYATGDQWRNKSRKNRGMEPKQKQYPVVDVTGDRSKVRCCKEQYCIGQDVVFSLLFSYLFYRLISQATNRFYLKFRPTLKTFPKPSYMYCYRFPTGVRLGPPYFIHKLNSCKNFSRIGQ